MPIKNSFAFQNVAVEATSDRNANIPPRHIRHWFHLKLHLQALMPMRVVAAIDTTAFSETG